jgi:hypothetical protein
MKSHRINKHHQFWPIVVGAASLAEIDAECYLAGYRCMPDGSYLIRMLECECEPGANQRCITITVKVD